MIFLKKILKIVIITFLSGAIFFGVAFAYLNENINNSTLKTDEKTEKMPYANIPENSGVIFAFPSGGALLAYLDFEKEHIYVLSIDNYDPTRPEYFGYGVDYTIYTSYELIAGIVDRVGGIEIEKDDTHMRYTGVHIVELLAKDNSAEIKNQIISQLFLKISQNGLSTDDFIYIIENSDSNLPLTECIFWLDYIKKMSENVMFIG